MDELHASPAAPPRDHAKRRLGVRWFMAAATVIAFAVLGSIAGGYFVPLLIVALLIAAVGLLAAFLMRRYRVMAWIVGLGISAVISWLLAVAMVLASYDATFWRVFGVVPPAG